MGPTKVIGVCILKEKEINMNDRDYMKIALDLAKGTKGQTSPNPVVGAVIVNQGRIVGMGAHLKAGQPHAEVHALNMAGSLAKNSTLYVTLEPCSHFGRTPPCAERIVAEQVKRVVVATLDPNPLVSGMGIDLLEKAGIEVTVGVLEQEAKQLNESFNKYITTRMPFVTVKTAMTLDGKIATYTGSSKWITGEKSRAYVHQLRHEHDAIMVGIGTILKDNPSLTVRTEVEGLNPIRIVVDSKLRIPLDAKVVIDGKAPTWIFTTNQVSEQKINELTKMGIQVIVTKGEESVLLQEVLQYLGKNHVTSVFVEGGSTLTGSLFDHGLIDKYIGFIAPKLVGGFQSLTSIGGEGKTMMTQAVPLTNISIQQFEDDFCITGYPIFSSSEGGEG